MAELKQNWKTFTVSDEIVAKYDELIKMILAHRIYGWWWKAILVWYNAFNDRYTNR